MTQQINNRHLGNCGEDCHCDFHQDDCVVRELKSGGVCVSQCTDYGGGYCSSGGCSPRSVMIINNNKNDGGGGCCCGGVMKKIHVKGKKKKKVGVVGKGRGKKGCGKKSKKKVVEKIPGLSRYWTDSEHYLFLMAMIIYGHKDLKRISEFVRTRNQTQVRTHSQKYFMRIVREVQKEGGVVGVGEGGKEGGKYSVGCEFGIGLLGMVADDTLEAVCETMGWEKKVRVEEEEADEDEDEEGVRDDYETDLD